MDKLKQTRHSQILLLGMSSTPVQLIQPYVTSVSQPYDVFQVTVAVVDQRRSPILAEEIHFQFIVPGAWTYHSVVGFEDELLKDVLEFINSPTGHALMDLPARLVPADWTFELEHLSVICYTSAARGEFTKESLEADMHDWVSAFQNIAEPSSSP